MAGRIRSTRAVMAAQPRAQRAPRPRHPDPRSQGHRRRPARADRRSVAVPHRPHRGLDENVGADPRAHRWRGLAARLGALRDRSGHPRARPAALRPLRPDVVGECRRHLSVIPVRRHAESSRRSGASRRQPLRTSVPRA